MEFDLSIEDFREPNNPLQRSLPPSPSIDRRFLRPSPFFVPSTPLALLLFHRYPSFKRHLLSLVVVLLPLPPLLFLSLLLPFPPFLPYDSRFDVRASLPCLDIRTWLVTFCISSFFFSPPPIDNTVTRFFPLHSAIFLVNTTRAGTRVRCLKRQFLFFRCLVCCSVCPQIDIFHCDSNTLKNIRYENILNGYHSLVAFLFNNKTVSTIHLFLLICWLIIFSKNLTTTIKHSLFLSIP